MASVLEAAQARKRRTEEILASHPEYVECECVTLSRNKSQKALKARDPKRGWSAKLAKGGLADAACPVCNGTGARHPLLDEKALCKLGVLR